MVRMSVRLILGIVNSYITFYNVHSYYINVCCDMKKILMIPNAS
jgi:hypothetical protein